MSSRQLALLLLLLVSLTLTLAWVIERRQIMSFRQELDAWGRDPNQPSSEGAAMVEPEQPFIPDGDGLVE
jgi:hypothetical protein